MLWLSTVPYGVWSKRISEPSMEENVQWMHRLEQVFGEAIDHFGLRLRDGTTINDLACAVASLIEGVWLNQCLDHRHPFDPAQPIAVSSSARAGCCGRACHRAEVRNACVSRARPYS